ncbi:MAG TPA: ABC transporter permease, partial [Rugosimonospora sp.]|nr:ABC transporter permease [Rugosimonospora sp.]
MLRLALATLRSHWVGFVGTLAALALGVAVIATMALVLTAASDGNPHREPVRFAAAPAVIRAKPAIHVTDRFGTPTDVSVAEQPELPASVVTGLAGATPDRTFYAMLPGGPADQAGHGWSSAAFAPYQLVAGHEPRADTEVVVTGGAQPGQTVTVLLRDGPHPFTVAGVVREPASGVVVEHPVFFTDSVAATLSPGVDALVTGDATLLAQARTLPGVQVLTGAQRHEADPGVLQDSADLSNLVSFLGIAALLSSCVSLYVTASTFGLSVAARRRDLALLRAAGAT